MHVRWGCVVLLSTAQWLSDDITAAATLFGDDKGTCHQPASCAAHESSFHHGLLKLQNFFLTHFTHTLFTSRTTSEESHVLIYQCNVDIILGPISIHYSINLFTRLI